MFLTVYLRSRLARYFLFHTSANWGSERDKVHLNELLRIPFPLPGSDLVSPGTELIVDRVTDKIRQLRNKLTNRLYKFEKKSSRDSLFDKFDNYSKKAWRRERKQLVDQLQSELEPLIYQYFGLTDQEIALVEDTTDIFIPSSTPTGRRSSQLITLDPVEKSKILPYAEKRMGAYADTLIKTLNTWAKAEGSTHRVFAESATDPEMGITMVTVNLAQKEKPYQEKYISSDISMVLKTYHESISNKRGAIEYERDILFFQGKTTLHIVRPNLLLNWTRTAALNDAARIYGEIVSAKRESR